MFSVSNRVAICCFCPQTLDALPSHLLTPFIGSIPPSNLLDKIARGVAEAKGTDWPHSMRATRAKIVELARMRARNSRDESASDTIAEEDSTDDAPLQPAAQDSAPTDDEGEDKPPNPDDAYAPSPSPAGDMEDEDDHIAATPVPSITSKVPDTTPGPAEVKVTTPAVVPLISPVVPAPSSIMAGSQLIAPVPSSPSSSSASGTPHVSPFPSRTPTPEQVSDRETGPKPASRRAKNTRTTRPIRARGRRKLKYEASDHEGDADHATGDIDDRDGMEDDMDMDSPDMEMESDLLPVHRAEALDVLAQIELKFAQLRERIYVEKMEDLAWEEALVAEGMNSFPFCFSLRR